MPILIIEGCDKTGKTSLATMLHGMVGAEVIKVSQPKTEDALAEYDELITHTLIPLAGIRKDKVIVLDRFHLGEFVYGPIFRGATPNPFRAGRLEGRLAEMNAQVVMMEDDAIAIEGRFGAHGEDFAQVKHIPDILLRYEEVYAWSTLPKRRARWSVDPVQNATLANHILNAQRWW